MYKIPSLKKYVIAAMLITLCAVLPLVLHALPGAGSTVLPMHIPVLLGGIILGPFVGMLVGLFGPMLSSFTTGMPTVAALPHMMAELAVYGFVGGLIAIILPFKNIYMRVYPSLIVAMILGRIVGGFVRIFILVPEATEAVFVWWITSYFITSAPGIIIQLILIPILIVSLEKAKVIGIRR